MAAYLVTWNLNKERSNYDAARRMLISLIQQYDYTFDPGLESVRFILTSQTANQVYDRLKSALDGNDRIIISKMNRKEYWGQLNPTVWSWIDARLL